MTSVSRGFTAWRFLRMLEDVLLGTLLVAMVLIVAAQILFRYVMNQPLSWSVDVATYLLVWTAFIGLVVAARESSHIALTIFEERLSQRTRKVVDLVRLGFMAVFLLGLLAGGLQWVTSQLVEQSESGIPVWVAYSSVPFGAALSLVHVAQQFWDLFRTEPRRTASQLLATE